MLKSETKQPKNLRNNPSSQKNLKYLDLRVSPQNMSVFQVQLTEPGMPLWSKCLEGTQNCKWKLFSCLILTNSLKASRRHEIKNFRSPVSLIWLHSAIPFMQAPPQIN